MTAEIAVMNKWGVALAADSKVTISGMRAAKAYDTVNKLFTLSKAHPVGIMVFGNAEFMDFPWETIIKMYRAQKKVASEKTIEAWGKNFVNYLVKFGKMDDGHKARNIKNILTSWFGHMIDRSVANAIAKGVSIGSDDYVHLLSKLIDSQQSEIVKSGAWMPIAQQERTIRKYKNAVAEAITGMLGSFRSEELVKSASRFAVAALFCGEFSPQSSGVVIAGFGEDEYFPTLVEYETDGYIGNRVKIQRKDISDISRSMTACIRSFAQHDMVQRFMNGADVLFLETLMNSFSATLTETSLAVLEQYGNEDAVSDQSRDEIRDAVKKAMTEIVDGAEAYIEKNFSAPVVDMVALLPKDELAHLAESLVALTSLKRRVSSDAETVGAY